MVLAFTSDLFHIVSYLVCTGARVSDTFFSFSLYSYLGVDKLEHDYEIALAFVKQIIPQAYLYSIGTVVKDDESVRDDILKRNEINSSSIPEPSRDAGCAPQ
jgi:hypothetical protein